MYAKMHCGKLYNKYIIIQHLSTTCSRKIASVKVEELLKKSFNVELIDKLSWNSSFSLALEELNI